MFDDRSILTSCFINVVAKAKDASAKMYGKLEVGCENSVIAGFVRNFCIEEGHVLITAHWYLVM